jgi:hypothetical protein
VLDFLLGMYLGRSYGPRQAQDHGTTHAAHRARSKADDLQAQVDRLSLFSLALAELLVERGGVTEEAILAKVQDIDLRDGRRDARSNLNEPPQPCASCKRMLAAHHVQCIYCGAARADVSPEGYLGR